jgi:hypothetical protein
MIGVTDPVKTNHLPIAARMALTVALARKSMILRPHSMVFSAGARLTPLIRKRSAAIGCFVRTLSASMAIINGHHHGRHREVIVQSFRSLIDALLCQPVRHGFEVVANVTLQFLSYSLNLQKTSTDRRNRMSNPAASVARETTSVPALNEHSSSGLENSTASLAVCDHTHLPRVVYAGFLQGSCSLFDSHSL